MFSIRGVKEGCGLFGIEHFILITITLIIICILLYFTKNFNHNQVKKVLKISCILLWILEVLKIIFVLQFTPLTSVNEYIPLYFCSMLLYATIKTAYNILWNSNNYFCCFVFGYLTIYSI